MNIGSSARAGLLRDDRRCRGRGRAGGPSRRRWARSTSPHMMRPDRTESPGVSSPEQRVGGDALAAAGLADEAEHRSGAHGERDSGDERGSVVDAEHEILHESVGRRPGAVSRRLRRPPRRGRMPPTTACAAIRTRCRGIRSAALAAPDRDERRRRGRPAGEHVGERIRRDDRERQERAGRHHHPGLLEDEARCGLDHAAPGGLGRLRTEADEGQARLHADGDAEDQHELHDHGGRHVRQDVTEAGGHRLHAVDGRGLDEQLLVQRLRLPEEHLEQRAEQQQAEERHDERHVGADGGDERRG